MKRRTFLLGTVSGLSMTALSACTPEPPQPKPTITNTRSRIPAPAEFRRASWSTDPFSRGSFSYQAVGSTPEHRVALRQPVGGRIFFAGEHTSDGDPGTVQGAEASGHRVATEIDVMADPGDRVAIVGAGIAGATAARRLSDAGFSVVVIEGRDRSGGRIHTVKDDKGRTPIELGAAWVRDSSGNDLVEELTGLGIASSRFDYRAESRALDGAVLTPSTVGPDAVTAAIGWAALQPADLSIADAVSDSGASKLSSTPDADGVSDLDRLASFLTTDVVIAAGAEAERLSSWYATDPTLGHDDDRLVLGEYQKLIDDRLEGLDILPTSTVSSVIHSDKGVSLRLARGESLSADRVVITVPLGVLKSDSIEFDPPLPFAHRGAIAALGMGMQDKLVLRFDKPFWSTDATVWTVVGDGVDFPLWFNAEPLTGEPMLIALTGGDDAVRLAGLSDQKLIDAALMSLEPFADPEPAGGG